MSREALKMALEALENINNWLPTIGQRGLRDYEADAITAIKDALAQPEHPEKMARLGWQYVECPACGSEGARAFPKPGEQPLTDVVVYKREWAGLTEEDMDVLYPHGSSVWVQETVKIIEAKLKEKNA